MVSPLGISWLRPMAGSTVELLTERYARQIAGVLSGYDRMIVQGTLPVFCYADGMVSFRLQVCCNGHDWLARQLDRKKIRYTLRDNVFTSIGDWQADLQAIYGNLIRTAIHSAIDHPSNGIDKLNRITRTVHEESRRFDTLPLRRYPLAIAPLISIRGFRLRKAPLVSISARIKRHLYEGVFVLRVVKTPVRVWHPRSPSGISGPWKATCASTPP
jgi:hypothetical protein